MKTVIKGKPARAAKRDLFAELREGMSALAEARQGKRTLRTTRSNTSQCRRSRRRHSFAFVKT